MSRLQTVEVEEATGKVKRILKGFQSSIGMVPNIFKGMANSASLLQATVTTELDFPKAPDTRAMTQAAPNYLPGP